MNIWLGHPHNLFLMLSAETGLPATILFCALLVWIFIAGVQFLQNSKSLDPEDRLIFFSYLVVFGAWVLFNTFDVTFFDLRLNTLSWLPIAAISGVVYRYNQHKKLVAHRS
jgi:O-antigen ligase